MTMHNLSHAGQRMPPACSGCVARVGNPVVRSRDTAGERPDDDRFSADRNDHTVAGARRAAVERLTLDQCLEITLKRNRA